MHRLRRRLIKAGIVATLGVSLDAPPLLRAGADNRRVMLPKLYRVPLGVKTGRLHEMDHAFDGCLWFWTSLGDLLLRYDPLTGKTEKHPLAAAERPPLHQKWIGRHYSPLVKNGKAYLSDIRLESRHLPVYHINTRSDTAKVFPYPYGAKGPWFGEVAPDGKTLWCALWDANALARFDLATGTWTGHWPTAFKDAQPTSGGLIDSRYYCPDLARPRLQVFDTAAEKWGEPIPVPGHGRDFGTLGGGLVYNGRLYLCLSTYKGYLPPGGELGIDGQPHHFLDRWLTYDPRTSQLAHLVCRGNEREYWLSCYGVVEGKHLYLTAFNARTANGKIAQGSTGDAAVFQTHPAGRPDVEPVLEEVTRLE